MLNRDEENERLFRVKMDNYKPSVLSDLLSCWELMPPEDQKERGQFQFILEGAQIYEGKWYAPKWGCDTLQHMLDIIKSR